MPFHLVFEGPTASDDFSLAAEDRLYEKRILMNGAEIASWEALIEEVSCIEDFTFGRPQDILLPEGLETLAKFLIEEEGLDGVIVEEEILLPQVEPFPVSFEPACNAVNLLAAVANDRHSPHAETARVVLEAWRAVLATPEQLAEVATNDDLGVDDEGACVSESAQGFWVQTWAWVEK